MDSGAPVERRDARLPSHPEAGTAGLATTMDARVQENGNDGGQPIDGSAVDVSEPPTDAARLPSDPGSDDGVECTSSDECDSGDVCLHSHCVLDPEASKVLWTRVWRRWQPHTVFFPTTAGRLVVGGPEQRIHFRATCYDAVDGLLNDTWRGYVNLVHVASDGSDYGRFGVEWSFETALSYGVDGAGRVIVGYHTRHATSDPGVLAYVKSLRPDGEAHWSFGTGTFNSFLLSLVVDDSGQITFQGSAPVGSPVDYGDGPVEGKRLVRFDRDGTLQWQRALVDAWADWILTEAGAAGEVFGIANSSATLTALNCPAAVPNSEAAMSLLKLDASGACLWAVGFSSDPEAPSIALAFDGGTGDVVLALLSGAEADFGVRPLPPHSAQDLLLARIAPDGSERWSQRWPAVDVEGVRLAASANGQVLISATMNPGILDLGGGPIAHAQPGHFLARFGPGGQLVGHHFIAQPEGYLWPLGIAADREGNAVVVGTNNLLNLGVGDRAPTYEASGTLSPDGPQYIDLWLAKLRIGAPEL